MFRRCCSTEVTISKGSIVVYFLIFTFIRYCVPERKLSIISSTFTSGVFANSLIMPYGLPASVYMIMHQSTQLQQGDRKQESYWLMPGMSASDWTMVLNQTEGSPLPVTRLTATLKWSWIMPRPSLTTRFHSLVCRTFHGSLEIPVFHKSRTDSTTYTDNM